MHLLRGSCNVYVGMCIHFFIAFWKISFMYFDNIFWQIKPTAQGNSLTVITLHKGNICINLIRRSNTIEATQPREDSLASLNWLKEKSDPVWDYPLDILFGHMIAYGSVVQLLLTHEAFYKNVTTRGSLLIKWCVTQQIHNVWNQKREGKWMHHWNYYTIAKRKLLQIFISAMSVVEVSLTL